MPSTFPTLGRYKIRRVLDLQCLSEGNLSLLPRTYSCNPKSEEEVTTFSYYFLFYSCQLHYTVPLIYSNVERLFYQDMYQLGNFVFETHISKNLNNNTTISRPSTITADTSKDSANRTDTTMPDARRRFTTDATFHTTRQEACG